VSAADAGAGVAGLTLVATSNEPESGTGDGDIAPDVVLTGGVMQLRAERAGNGAGRVYTITARATDRAGNVATETRTCVVPHDRGVH
jgi:pantoate kinase